MTFYGLFLELAEAQCELNGESSTCQERIDWTQASGLGSRPCYVHWKALRPSKINVPAWKADKISLS